MDRAPACNVVPVVPQEVRAGFYMCSAPEPDGHIIGVAAADCKPVSGPAAVSDLARMPRPSLIPFVHFRKRLVIARVENGATDQPKRLPTTSSERSMRKCSPSASK